jgi:hypothetical protein
VQPHCLNCSYPLTGNFCTECGQRSRLKRINFHSLAHDIPHSVFHVDKGFAYSFVQLLKRPGRTIREYIEGKRISHYSPVAYLLILCAASSFFSHLISAYLEKVNPAAIGTNEGLVVDHETARFFSAYPALVFCLMLPVISFWSWLFNRDQKYNYWENVVLNIYLVAQFNLFFIVYGIIRLIVRSSSASMTPMLIAFFTYMSFGYFQFFGRKNSVKAILSRILLILMIMITVLTTLSFTGVMTAWWTFY